MNDKIFFSLAIASNLLFQSVQAAALGGFVIDTKNREQVRSFYRAVYGASDNVNAEWNGNIANCNPGTTSVFFRDAVLLRINYFRAMAGVPAT